MRTDRLWLPLLALFALASAPALTAAERTLVLDPDATEVAFSLDATGHDVHGTLQLQRGTVTFDPEAGTASGEIAIDATRAETGNDKRDETMHTKVLETGTYPLFVFSPQAVEGAWTGAGSEQLRLIGTLAIHGGEHPLTMPARVTVDGDRVEAEATFEIPYVDWGMHDPSVFILRVADTVEVTVHAVGSLETPAADDMAAEP
ncbi:MAG: YceI family protein [Thermoanaerobaculia bacterium]